MGQGSSLGDGPRSRAEKDAVTVEIGYALVGACLLAVVAYAVFAAPVVLWTLPRGLERTLLAAGTLVAGGVAVVHVVRVLRRFRVDRTERELQRLLRSEDSNGPSGPDASDQP